MRKSFALVLLLGVLSFACEEDPIVNPVPSLELISIGPQVVMEFEDSVVIRLFYKDGDGDLGGGHPDSANFFVEDNRAGIINEFRLQTLVPNNNSVPIQGEIDLRLNSLFISDSSNSQSVNFTIHCVDRAGNESNRVTTGELIIRR